jgi:predicted nucleotidyltransferase
MSKKMSNRIEIIDIIASAGCLQLLEPFLYRPGIELYQSELIKLTGVPLNRALRLLNLLVSHGILHETEKAGSKFYSVSPENPVLKQLKILNIVSKLFDLTREFTGKNIEVYLFGSAAKGEDTEKSDIDLLIIADTDKTVVNKLIDRMMKGLAREISPVVYSSLEYANLYNKEKVFYESIERYKIRVL